MTPLPIAKDNEPILRQIAQPVPLDWLQHKDFQDFIAAMLATMRQVEGVGLAAPQVYRSWRIVIAECQNNRRYPGAPPVPLQIWINPEIVAVSPDLCSYNEGCLSVTNRRGQVWRPRWLDLVGYTPNGDRQQVHLTDFAARIIQHEIDHLNGILFSDYLI